MKRLLTLSGRSTMRLPYRLLAFILGSTLLLTGCEEYLTDIELDPQAPLVTSFMIEPDSINITNVDAEVTTTVGVRGEVPVDSVRVTLEEQSAGLVSCLSTVPAEGDRENGSWACTIPFPTVAQAGRWHTASLEIFPEVGDRVLLIYDELEEAGYPHYLNVVKFGGLQIEAPTTTLRDIGEQVQLTAILRDDEGNIVPGIEPTWSSSAEEVATVDPEGLVEAVGEGTTTITARADGLEATLVVTVELGAGPQAPEIHAMVVRPDTVDLLDAGSVNYAVLAVFPATGSPALDSLSATLSGPNGQKLTCSDIQQIPVSELDPSIVENEFGVTLQEGAPDPWACSFDFEGGSQSDSLVGSWQVSEVVLGSSGELFVMSGGELADAGYDLTVEVIRSGSEVSFIFILPQEVTLTAEGDTAHLTATAYDQFENVVENVEFVWETSDESVALVDEAGVVTAFGSGTATITASIGDLAGTATVTVEAAPAEYWAGWVQGGISTDRGPNIAISMDGVNWTVGERIFGITSSSVNGIATNGELWVITGNGTRLQTIATSVDAQNWTLRDSPLERGITAEWIDDRWYIGGLPGREGGSPLAVSDDGIEWTELPIPALTQVNTIAYNGTRWIVGGHGDGANVITSTDGVNWTELDIDIGLANTAAWNGEIWVLVGQGEGATRDTDRILTSTDGIVWTRQESPVNEGIRDIAWNGANWVVAGRSNAGELPHIAISEDAINWTVAPSPFSSWAATSVVWNGKTWLMGGGFTTTVATSEDGLEWEGQVSPINNSTNVLAWGGSRPINMAPSATITAPTSGAEYMAGDPIEFTATVEDAEDGMLPSSSIVWTSDLDGEIGTGTSLTTSSLSGGTHQVTLTATDSYGAVTRRVVEVEVIGRVGPGPVDRVIVQPQEVTLTAEGDTARLRATAIDQFENVVTKAEFAWDTSDESVALVDHEGLVTAMGPGTATITATTGEVSGTATVTVEIGPAYWDGWVQVGRSISSGHNFAISADGQSWQSGMLPFGGAGAGLDVATNGEQWVAVGYTTYKIATSVDALEWRPRVTHLNRGYAVVWHNDRWVVGGEVLSGGDVITTSEDGASWTPRSAPLAWVHGMASNGELIVAVGRGVSGSSTGGIATSTDGVNWTLRPSELESGSAVAWNGELWVAVGARDGATTSQILTSPDGIVWTSRESPLGSNIRDVAWNGSTWIAAGDGPSSAREKSLAISADGIEWEAVEAPFTQDAHSIAWNGEYWMAGGSFSVQTAISADGYDWTPVSSGINYSVNAIAWGGSQPVNMAPSATITAPNFGAEYMTGDPIEFSATVEDAEDGTLPSSSIVWTSNLDGQIGTGASFTTSSLSSGTHQITLTATDSRGVITRRVTEVVVIASVASVEFVVVLPQEATLTAEGDTVHLTATAYDAMENVIDGINFTWSTSDESVAVVTEEGVVAAINNGTATITAWAGDVGGSTTLNVEIPVDYWPGWVAVGSTSASSPRLATSMDGEFWSPQEIPATMIDVADVAANGERWMAVGGLFNETKLITSVDAVTWTAGQLPLDRGAAVIWADDKWVVSGRPLTTGGPNIAYSTDGETWSTVKVPNLTLVNNIAWNGELWIAVGSGGIATSPDLQSWTHRPADLTNGSAIGWNGEHWVVGGQGTGATGRLLSSTDGIDWTLHNALDAASYTDVVWNGATWIVTARPRIGDVPMMAYSGDSTNWIPIEDQAFSSLAYGIAWNGRHWVAVGGIGNNVARSFNGLDWDGPFFTGIGADANAIAWGGGEPVNQAPRVTVSSPGMVTEHMVGDDVEFSAIVEDAEDGTLPSSSIVWTSDLDGQIGTGASFSTSSLSGGVHKVTVTATDSYGAVTQRQIEVIMIEIVLDPELLGIFVPDTVNARSIKLSGLGTTILIAPLAGTPNADTITARVSGPNSETFGCSAIESVNSAHIIPEEFEQIFGKPKPANMPNIMVCRVDFDLGPYSEAPIPALGTWSLTEVGIRQSGIWNILGEQELAVISDNLTFELIDEDPGIDWASIDPWRARIGADGDTVRLDAVGGYYGTELPTTGITFQWSSSDPSIATVDADGLVTAVGPGEVAIIAESDGVTAQANIQVIASGPPIAWDTVAAGFSHSCGLTNGTAYCWGKNDYGEIGNGGTETEVIPTRVAGGHTFSSIATGAYFTVGITPSGEAYAWGRNDNGQLGDGTTTDRLVPVPVSGQNAFSMVSAAANHVVALTTAGEIYTWGNNDRGQLGNDGMPRDNLVPVRVGGSPILGETFTSVSAGNFFTVALRSDSIAVTWGMNNSGQLGHGSMTTSNPTPTMVMRQDGTGFHRFTTLFATSTDVVALDADGQAWGWGRGFAGSHGNGQNSYSAWPVKALGGHTFVWIGGGGNYRFAIDNNGQTWGWGEGTQGRLGIGDDVSHWEPVLVTQGFVKYAVGDSHTIALDASGMAYSWGNNLFDVLGIASYESAFEPVPVLGPLD